MKIGYARCSTRDQNLELQTDALRKAGCEIIFKERGESGRKKHRPELDRCLASLNRGDTLVVWKLDRLFRSVVHFANAWINFRERGIELISITQGFETSSSAGRLMMHILSGFAEFESDMISERVTAGMRASIIRGKKMGRKIKYVDAEIIKGSVPRSTYYRRRK